MNFEPTLLHVHHSSLPAQMGNEIILLMLREKSPWLSIISHLIDPFEQLKIIDPFEQLKIIDPYYFRTERESTVEKGTDSMN